VAWDQGLSSRLDRHKNTVTADRLFTSNRDVSKYTVEESFIAKVPMSFRTRAEMAAEDSIIKMMLVGEADALRYIISQIPPDFTNAYTTVSSSPNFFEILNKEVSKGQGLIQLAKILDIPLAETMAIGDAENDLSMLEAAGLAIAMGNAVPEIIAIADFQTSTNDEHGVAVALEKFVLKN
jgi:Cof subfamily protein (haloacid dehalogenase superfamily)